MPRKTHTWEEWAEIASKLEFDEQVDVFLEAMAQAFHEGWESGYEEAERIDNTQRGYELLRKAIGDRAARPNLEPHESNPYAEQLK